MVSGTRQDPWIQVIGNIAIHPSGRDPVVLAGSTRTLLAVLVAAGPTGAWTEEIARAYWNDTRPPSWRIALRAAMSHLNAQLPDGWHVSTTDMHTSLIPGPGWIDAWRVVEEAPFSRRPSWLTDGLAFDGVARVPLIANASLRLAEILPGKAALSASSPLAAPDVLDRYLKQIEGLRCALILGALEDRLHLADGLRRDEVSYTRVIGDRGLLLPLGPYAVAFPELRDSIAIEQGVVAQGAVVQALRLVRKALADRAATEPHRLVVGIAEQLDPLSLLLTSTLIEQSPGPNISILLGADVQYRDIRWLDFVSRAQTAGCPLVRLDTSHG